MPEAKRRRIPGGRVRRRWDFRTVPVTAAPAGRADVGIGPYEEAVPRLGPTKALEKCARYGIIKPEMA